MLFFFIKFAFKKQKDPMLPQYIDQIAHENQFSRHQVEATLKLLDEGATIPFISRYRKEATGQLDEVQVATIKEASERLTELEQRKETILATIDKAGLLTESLRQKIAQTHDAVKLEDLYLPYKPKRITRAEKAKKRGLAPLAQWIAQQAPIDLPREGKRFLSEEVPTLDAVLQGARDIIAEQISEDERTRSTVRSFFERGALISAKLIKGKAEEGEKYRDYFEYTKPLKRCSSHQLLALRRAEREKILRLDISPDSEACLNRLDQLYITPHKALAEQKAMAVTDAYKRLLKPSIETEFAQQSKQKADQEAIQVFTANLRQLLLAPPLGQKRILAIDPGFRSGCKVVCLDEQGDLVYNEAIFPHPPQKQLTKASAKVAHLVEAYAIEAIAIGNGTASRETERFITHIQFDRPVKVFVVSESGASIYSASPIARKEFPAYDVTVRGAISIGRRLMDPLAELVKIDPKSIGVGQYQHDVDQTALKKSLDQTVESCVNKVGVNLNTASEYLLRYVSGLGATLAHNIVTYRSEKGAFTSRQALLNVPRMGAKTFEQCAGFLRVPQSANPLDHTAVHPEQYGLVEKIARDLGVTIKQLVEDATLRKQIRWEAYVTDQVGMPTLLDIKEELEKPGRDPRAEVEVFSFDPTLSTINDVHEGQILPGIIGNVTNFGCFVDIGIKENGLVHISEITDHFINDPAEVVSVQQHVTVKVIAVDVPRKRISLSMKGLNQK